MQFKIPDNRFPVAVAAFNDGKKHYIFASTMSQQPAHKTDWRKVPGVNAFLAGPVDDALAGLLANYTNAELAEMIGLHPTPLSKLRKFLKVTGGTRR